MRIHYNNGQQEKIIDNVLSIMIVDNHTPITVALKNGKELQISLNNIEMILDEAVFEGKPAKDSDIDK
mgnify:CR=1 FL=1